MTLRDPAALKRWWPEASLAIPALLGVTMAVRFAGVNAAPGETGLAAIDLLRNGVIGNPYGVVTGPTAHVSPLHVALLALVFALFGENSAAARVVLGLLCTAVYVAAGWGVIGFARRHAPGRLALGFCMVLLSILPVELPLIVVSARQWDQPFGALILLASLLVCTHPSLCAWRPRRAEALLGLLAGVAGLVSPSVMPAVLLGAARVCVLRAGWRNAWRPGLLCALMVALFLLPWGLRNRAELGGFVLTRSNAALELSVGNEDGATGRSDHVSAAHPHDSAAAARRIREIGELPYMAEMRARAMPWIAAHPGRFAVLTTTRVRLLFFPDASMAGWDPVFPPLLTVAVLWIVSALRFWAAIVAPRSWGDRVVWWGHCFLPLAPYAITHVSLRYTYTVFFAGLCLVAAWLGIVQDRMAGDRAGRDMPAG